MEEITNPPDLPCTMTKLTEDLGAHQFDDLTDQVPDPMEFQQACEEEQAPLLRRVRQKRAVPECPKPSREVSGLEESDQFGHLVSEELQEGEQDHYAECFWSSASAAVEVEIPLPGSTRGKRHMVNNFQSFILSSQLRRRGIEVSERNMDDEELKLMQTAKQEDVKKFIGADALKCLPPHLQPSKQVAMKMRWVLTWKKGG